MSTADVFEQALRLPTDDRRALADALTASLDAQHEVTRELAAFLDERLAELEANPDAWRPGDDVLRDLRARYLAG